MSIEIEKIWCQWSYATKKQLILLSILPFFTYWLFLMARLKTNAKKKLNKALVRVEKVVVMSIRNQVQQQRKWKAEVVKRKG